MFPKQKFELIIFVQIKLLDFKNETKILNLNFY